MTVRQKRSSPNLNLKVSGKIFSVKKSLLVEKTDLFQTDPFLLTAEEYEVKAQVPESVFAEFVQLIESGEITVSEETWKPLKLLSEEFECEVLAKECAAFAESHPQTRIESLIDSLSKRISDLEEIVQNKIGSLESEICRISEMCGRLDNRLSGHIQVSERANGAFLERLGDLESEEHKQIASLEQRHGKLIKAVKSENIALRERLAELEPKGEKIRLPPLGHGILRFLKQRKCIVQITVSSHYGGSTGNLLTEDDTYWASTNEPKSWIQWTISGGIKAIISSVKIRGNINQGNWHASGVKDFIIGGSNDNAVWTTIIDSKTCPTTFENFVTQAEALLQPQPSFSMIRLTQTGSRYCPKNPNNHELVVTYVDFGGEVIFPKTAK
jgi:hypothetical protein